MKKLAFSLFLFFSISSAFSQKVYFVYLQTESSQTFYVKLNDKTYSSSLSGYLILSKLLDTTYKFSVGFPKNKWPEQKFSVEVNGKDHGYLLKNFDDGSWGLFDLQTMAIQIAPADTRINSSSQKGAGRVSLFTDVLSKAANDPSLRERPVSVSDSKRSIVIKRSEVAGKDGLRVVFIDEYVDGRKDTINITIPDTPGSKKVTQQRANELEEMLNKEGKIENSIAISLRLTENDISFVQSSYFLRGRKMNYSRYMCV
jgi:hypothetical protein